MALGSIDGNSDGDHAKVTARDPFHYAGKPEAGTAGGPALVWFERIPTVLCTNNHLNDTSVVDQCPPPTDLNITCPQGALTLDPLYKHTRTITTDGTPTNWGKAKYQAGASRCLEPADLADAARKAFRTLQVTPSPLHVQPASTQVLVNIPTITYTDPTTQTFTITLLHIPVEVRATPATYTWTYGDNTPPLITTDPGHPYPDQSIQHTYTHATPATITLTTTWHGTFRIQGTTTNPDDPDTWTPITGTLTTTTPTHPLTVVARNTHLVAGN
jgi:hypothetical protein